MSVYQCESCRGHQVVINDYEGLLSLGSEILDEVKLMDENKSYADIRYELLFRNTKYWKECQSITSHQAWKTLSDICIKAGILFHKIRDKKENVNHFKSYEERHYNFINNISFELVQRIKQKTKVTGVKLNVKKAR